MNLSDLRRSRGFTLIEIVLVLVLIGILVAVAVAKYFDLTQKADEIMAKSIGAEMQARVNGSFAAFLLEGNDCKDFPSAPEDAMMLGIEMTKEINNPNISIGLADMGSADGVTATFSIKVNDGGASVEVRYPPCSLNPDRSNQDQSVSGSSTTP